MISFCGAELNQAFHFRIMQIARMPVLSVVIQRIWLQMGPVIADAHIDGGRSMIEHHYPVIEALRKRRDPDAAAANDPRMISSRAGRLSTTSSQRWIKIARAAGLREVFSPARSGGGLARYKGLPAHPL